MSSPRRRLSLLALLAAGLAATALGQASGPHDIAAGADGNLWFTEFQGNKIGRITPAGVITEFSVPSPGSAPSGIAAGPDGNLWFTEAVGGKIGRISAATGVISEFPLPAASSNRGLASIVAGADGNLWFTEGRGARIGRITTAGVVTEFPAASFTFPGGIASGATELSPPTDEPGFGSRIGRMTTTGVTTEFSTSSDEYAPSPTAITVGSRDDNLWFAPSATGGIGRMTTGGSVTEFPLPLYIDVRGMAAGSGVVWFTEKNGNKIGQITLSGHVTEFSIPTAGSEPSGIAVGRDGNIWFTESQGNKIGRITPSGDVTEFSIPAEIPPEQSSCTADSTTLCLNGGRFQVRAEWQVPSQGTSGHGNAASLTDDTGTFWFFEASSVEVVVKVLDACSLDGHAWVFAGGLTNVAVTLTVTDTQTDVEKTYTNAAGTAFQPIQDTTAFSTCP